MDVEVLILGSGYSGVNVYYNIRKKGKLIISDSNEFKFYTSLWRNNLDTIDKIYLDFVKTDSIKDIDIKARCIKSAKLGEICAENIIIALGCDKSKLIATMRDILKYNNVSITVEDPLIEYLGLQFAFYLKRLGKDVKYYGNYLSMLGDKVSQSVQALMEKYNIRSAERADIVIPSCEPPQSLGFLKVNERLELAKGVYAIGDIIYGWPKLGELAMREGVFLGKGINKGVTKKFNPIFIYILDTGFGNAIHIRSDVFWGGTFQSVKRSRIRSFMKRFIEHYYVFRKGNMGFLYYL